MRLIRSQWLTSSDLPWMSELSSGSRSCVFLFPLIETEISVWLAETLVFPWMFSSLRDFEFSLEESGQTEWLFSDPDLLSLISQLCGSRASSLPLTFPSQWSLTPELLAPLWQQLLRSFPDSQFHSLSLICWHSGIHASHLCDHSQMIPDRHLLLHHLSWIA